MANTDGPANDARYRPRPESLPLEVRQELWKRLWDLLLTPGPEQAPPGNPKRPDPVKEPRS